MSVTEQYPALCQAIKIWSMNPFSAPQTICPVVKIIDGYKQYVRFAATGSSSPQGTGAGADCNRSQLQKLAPA